MAAIERHFSNERNRKIAGAVALGAAGVIAGREVYRRLRKNKAAGELPAQIEKPQDTISADIEPETPKGADIKKEIAEVEDKPRAARKYTPVVPKPRTNRSYLNSKLENKSSKPKTERIIERFTRVSNNRGLRAAAAAGALIGAGAVGYAIAEDGGNENNVSNNLTIDNLEDELRDHLDSIRNDISSLKGQNALTDDQLRDINARLDALDAADNNSTAGDSSWKSGDMSQQMMNEHLDKVSDGVSGNGVNFDQQNLKLDLENTLKSVGATSEDLTKYNEYFRTKIKDNNNDAKVYSLNQEDLDEVSFIARAAGPNFNGRQLPEETASSIAKSGAVKDLTIKNVDKLSGPSSASRSEDYAGDRMVTLIGFNTNPYMDVSFERVCEDTSGDSLDSAADILKVYRGAKDGDSNAYFSFENGADVSAEGTILKPASAYGGAFVKEDGTTDKIFYIQGADTTEGVKVFVQTLNSPIVLNEETAQFSVKDTLYEGSVEGGDVEIDGNFVKFRFPGQFMDSENIRFFAKSFASEKDICDNTVQNEPTSTPEPSATETPIPNTSPEPTATATQSINCIETDVHGRFVKPDAEAPVTANFYNIAQNSACSDTIYVWEYSTDRAPAMDPNKDNFVADEAFLKSQKLVKVHEVVVPEGAENHTVVISATEGDKCNWIQMDIMPDANAPQNGWGIQSRDSIVTRNNSDCIDKTPTERPKTPTSTPVPPTSTPTTPPVESPTPVVTQPAPTETAAPPILPDSGFGISAKENSNDLTRITAATILAAGAAFALGGFALRRTNELAPAPVRRRYIRIDENEDEENTKKRTYKKRGDR